MVDHLQWQNPATEAIEIDYEIKRDDLGRTSKYGPAANPIQYTYARLDLVSSETVPHVTGHTLNYTYDAFNRVTAKTFKDGGVEVLKFEYVYHEHSGRLIGVKINACGQKTPPTQ